MRTVVRNITWIFMAQLITMLLGVVVLIAAPRGLGDTDFGRAAFAATFVGYFALLINLGTSSYLVKAVARDPDAFGLYVVNVLAAKTLLAVAGALAAIATAQALGYDRTTVELVAISSIWVVFNELSSTLAGGLEGLQEMGGLAVISVVAKVVMTVLLLTAVWAEWGVLWYTAMLPIAYGLQFILTYGLTRTRVRHTGARIQLSVIRRAFIGGFPFFFSSAILLVYGTIDIPMLQSMAGSETVAWYSVAYQWIALPAFFAGVIVRGVMPSLSAQGRTVSSLFTSQANKALRLVFLVGAPIATGLALCAGDMLRILYPNSSFTNAVPIMRILAVHLPVVSLSMIIGASLAASDRQRPWVILGVIAAALNIGLNVAAIPWSVRHFDNGAIGAAIVTVGTEGVILTGALLLRPRGVLDRATAGFLFRCTLACAAMIPPVLAIDASWVGYKIALGVATFVVFATALRVATPGAVIRALGQVRRSMARSG